MAIIMNKRTPAIEQLIRHRCAALVVHAKMIPDAELIHLMKQMPGMVIINRIIPGFEKRCVALDDRYGAACDPSSDSTGSYPDWLSLLQSPHF